MRAAGVAAGLALVGGACVLLSTTSGHRDLPGAAKRAPTTSTSTSTSITTTTRLTAEITWARSRATSRCELANLPEDGSPLGHVTRKTAATGPAFRGFGESVVDFRIGGGWEMAEDPDLEIHVDTTGLVVMELDTSVVSSTDDYRAFRVNDDGVARLVRLADHLTLDPLAERSGSVGPQEVVLDVSSPERDLGTPNVGPTIVAQRPPRRCVSLTPDEVAAALVDLGWLGDDIVTPVGPWIPDSMSFEVRTTPRPRSGHLPTDPWAPWPLDRSIEELLGDAPDSRPGNRYLVIEGDDVPKVFALLDGANHTALWVDDGTKYELDVADFGP